MFITHVQVFPEVSPERGGGFTPTSFDHLMHLEVHLPGLDPAAVHTLVDAQTAVDGAAAELVLHSSPRAPQSLDRNLRIVTWQPAAYVRAHTKDGEVLCETKLDAPLQPGQLVEVGGVAHRVAPAEDRELWPHRDPATGVCKGQLDWQHVTLIPEPQPPHQPVPAKP